VTDNPQALMAVSVGLILCCIIVIVLFIIFVHTMPGKIARKRGNPQAEAIEVLSLLGLLIFPLWMAALVWAFVRPFTVPVEAFDTFRDWIEQIAEDLGIRRLRLLDESTAAVLAYRGAVRSDAAK